MVAVYALFVAALIVCGQALWKFAVEHLAKEGGVLLSTHGVIKLITSPPLLLGVLVYIVATVGYVLLLSKFKYFQVQSLVVGSSLILTFCMSVFLFKEQASLVNVAGIVAVTVGALLIIR